MSNLPVHESGYQNVLAAIERDAGVQGGYSTSLRDVLGDNDPSIYSKNILEALEVSFEKALNKDTSEEAVKVFHKVNALVHDELSIDYVKDCHDLLTHMYDKVNSLPDTTKKGVPSERKSVALELYNSALESYGSVNARVKPEIEVRGEKDKKQQIIEAVARRGVPTSIRSVLQNIDSNIADVRPNSVPSNKVSKAGRAK